MRHAPLVLVSLFAACAASPSSPQGFDDFGSTQQKPLWNGKDLSGWHGQRHFDPYKLETMPAAERAKKIGRAHV